MGTSVDAQVNFVDFVYRAYSYCVMCIAGYRPILDAMKTFAKTGEGAADATDIEVSLSPLLPLSLPLFLPPSLSLPSPHLSLSLSPSLTRSPTHSLSIRISNQAQTFAQRVERFARVDSVDVHEWTQIHCGTLRALYKNCLPFTTLILERE